MIDRILPLGLAAAAALALPPPAHASGRTFEWVETFAPDCAVTSIVTEAEYNRRKAHKPSFNFRNISIWDVYNNEEFAKKLHLSGPFPFDKVLGSCHTFMKIIPPEKYFDAHPEYFAEVKGVRRRVQSQPCLSNPDVLKIAVKFVLDRVKNNPAVKYFGVSQNDWDGHCTCKKCLELDEAEGSPAASIINFVNKIAEEVEKVRPDAIIETLAYQYSIKPPKTIRPRRNVMPCFCTIECDFSRPLNKSAWRVNRATARYLAEWCKISNEVYVWDYATNFRHYCIPFANLRAMAANIKFFHECGVTKLFEQSCRQTPHSDLAELKTYVAAKLMWDSSLDPEVLIRDFCNAYYGVAADEVLAYIDHIESVGRDVAKRPMQINEDVTSAVYSDEFFDTAAKFWHRALEKAKGDKVLTERINWGLFGVDVARVLRFLRSEKGGSVYATENKELILSPEHTQMRRIARRIQPMMVKKPGIWLSERGDISSFFKRQIITFAIFDPPGEDKADGFVPEWCIETVSAVPVKRVSDPDAISKHAIESANIYSGRTAMFDMANALIEKNTEYRILARVKVNGLSSVTGELFRCGVYQGSPLWKEVSSVSFHRKDVDNEGYSWYPCGTFVPQPGQKIFFAPGKDFKAYKSVTLNAFRIIPVRRRAIKYDGGEWPSVKPEFQPDAQSRKPQALKRKVDRPSFDLPPKVTVVRNGASSRICIDGKPFPMFVGRINTGVRADHTPKLAELPFNTAVVDGFYPHALFPAKGEVDTEYLIRRGMAVATNNPSAYLIWAIDVNPSNAWAAENPDEICRDSAGEMTRDGLAANWSTGSKKAVEEMKALVDKVVSAVESSPLANRVIGYMVTSCHTTEWLGWQAKNSRTTDYSPVAKREFAEFARKRYGLEGASVPAAAARRAPEGSRLLWKPREHLNAAAYHEWVSGRMAANLIEVCRAAKNRLASRKLVGTYYGYTMTLFADGNTHARAHFALEKVLDSGAVDFLMSPQDYLMRTLGEPSIDMKPFASIAARGIVPMIENDVRTHFAKPLGVYPKGHSQTFTARQSRAVIRRDMSFALCRNQPLYLYDLVMGNGFNFDECIEDAPALEAANRWNVRRSVDRKAEIAVVYSEKSAVFSPQLFTCVPHGFVLPSYDEEGNVRQTVRPCRLMTGELSTLDLSRISRVGAGGVDYLLAEALERDPGDYKLYVFLNCTSADESLLAAARKLRGRKCTILWTYAPGYLKGADATAGNMRELTGFDLVEKPGAVECAAVFADGSLMGTAGAKASPLFEVRDPGKVLARYVDGTAAVAAKRTGKALSVYSGVWLYDTAFLGKIASLAGVHRFVETDDPVEANANFFALHSRRGGAKEVKLPKETSVVDVFAGKIVARKAKSFKFEAPIHTSHLFYYGDDADAFLATLPHD